MKNRILKMLVVGLFISSTAFAQQDELKKMFQDTYARALKYNDRLEAKTAMYRLVALEPENDSLLTNLAFLYADARQYASSVLVSMDVLQLNPDNVEALEINAFSYDNLGLKDKSLESYEKLYLLTSDFQILYKMAFLQLELEKYQQALTNADILLESPEVEEATVFFKEGEEDKEYSIKVAIWNLKGVINRDMGDKEAARVCFEEALKIAPDFTLAKENITALDE